jgi:hypothetical protein
LEDVDGNDDEKVPQSCLNGQRIYIEKLVDFGIAALFIDDSAVLSK